MRRQFAVFLIRWLLNSFGLWLAVRLLGTGYDDAQVNASLAGFLLAGLIFSLVNTILRPIIVILSLPAILLTLGLFLLVVNAAMIGLVSMFVPGMEVHGLWAGVQAAVVTGIVSWVGHVVLGDAKRERD